MTKTMKKTDGECKCGGFCSPYHASLHKEKADFDKYGKIINEAFKEAERMNGKIGKPTTAKTEDWATVIVTTNNPDKVLSAVCRADALIDEMTIIKGDFRTLLAKAREEVVERNVYLLDTFVWDMDKSISANRKELKKFVLGGRTNVEKLLEVKSQGA